MIEVRFARDCRCGTDPETGEQITWCVEHNGWEYGRKMDAARQRAEQVQPEDYMAATVHACVQAARLNPSGPWALDHEGIKLLAAKLAAKHHAPTGQEPKEEM